jgi:hypothetical protein
LWIAVIFLNLCSPSGILVSSRIRHEAHLVIFAFAHAAGNGFLRIV